MKLEIHDGFLKSFLGIPYKHKALLQRAFRWVKHQPEIDVASSNVTILMVINHERTAEGAATAGKIVDGTLKMRMSDAQGVDNMLNGLCHEMVHVRQVLKGELTQTGTGLVWHGKPFSRRVFHTIKDFSNLAASHGNQAALDLYKMLPWEAEAYKLQEVLYARLRRVLSAK